MTRAGYTEPLLSCFCAGVLVREQKRVTMACCEGKDAWTFGTVFVAVADFSNTCGGGSVQDPICIFQLNKAIVMISYAG